MGNHVFFHDLNDGCSIAVFDYQRVPFFYGHETQVSAEADHVINVVHQGGKSL